MFQGIDPHRALEIVRNSPTMAFDTETTGLTINDTIVGWVFTDYYASIYIPTRHGGGGNIPDPGEFERVLDYAFRDRTRRGFTTIGHNLGFDLRMAAKHAVFPMYPLEDTQINESLINDTTRGYGLDDCCNRHGVTPKLGADLYAAIAAEFGGPPDRKQMSNYWRMSGDDPVVIDYATGDGISTLELRNAQQKKIDEFEIRRAWELECKLIHRVARIHMRGLKVDAEYADRVSGVIQGKIDEAQKKFTPGFNTNSPKEVEALYRANGYTDSMFIYTPQKAPSFVEAWLKTNEIGEAIMAVRQMKKARDSFVTPLVETHNVKGRVHPILNQSKSDEYGVTGSRFSCSDPNLQAFPKRNKAVGKVVRRLIIADDGHELQEGDAKQQEPRLFAYFSGDERLLEGYRTGTLDIHDLTSTGLNLDRDTAKRLGMGMLTGMQAKALAGHMRWDLPTAEKYWNGFFREFGSIQKFQNDAKAIFKGTGYVKSLSGRRAYLDDPRFAYRATSRIIQNSGGDLIKQSLLDADEWCDANPQVQILMTIHDSLMWQREVGFDTSELVRILEAVPPKFGVDVPIPYEVGTGYDWATASYGE